MSKISKDDKKQTVKDIDKRIGKRVSKKASICWRCFNPNAGSEVYDAQMINFSERGMYFESDYFSKTRPVICINVKSALSHHDAETTGWLRSIRVGEVKWWKEIDDKDHFRFGVGVQYYL